MIYKFKSKATGDTIMLGPQGDLLLKLIGREPSVQGIIEPVAMPAAIDLLQRAVVQDDEARRGEADAGDDPACPPDAVSLRRRMWPMVEMLRRALAAGEPVVWGV